MGFFLTYTSTKIALKRFTPEWPAASNGSMSLDFGLPYPYIITTRISCIR